MYAFSVSSDCCIECECGVELTLEIPFNGMSVPEHDRVCKNELVKAWNGRWNPHQGLRLTKRIGEYVYYTQGKYEETLPAEMEPSDIRRCLKRLCDYEEG